MPFEIPENWCWTTLGDVGKWQSGATPSRLCKEYYGGDIPWLKTGDLNDGYITDIPEYITQKALKETSVKLNPAGSILIAMYGATIGKVGILTFPATTNQACCACVEYEATDQQYLFYFLLSHKENFIRQGGGGAQPNISKEKIVETLLPLPPFNEQKRIVNEVEKWFSIIDKIESSTIELESYVKHTKSKILDLAISGKLVPQDPNDEPAIKLLKRINPGFEPCDNSHYGNLPFEIPSTWVWVSHNDMLEISGGAQPPKSEFSEVMKPGYIRLYQIRDYGEKPIPIYIPLSTASKTTVKGDILLARYGGSLGKVFIAEDGAYNVAMAKVILCYPEVLNQKFVYYYYLSSIYQNKLRSISRTAQAGFNSGDFEDMYFPLPPLEEQGRIVDAISSIWEMIDMITAEL